MSLDDYDWLCDSCGAKGCGKSPKICPVCEEKQYLLCKESGWDYCYPPCKSELDARLDGVE